MRFCLAFCYLGMGGTETLMIRMSRWLLAHGHRVTVLTPEDSSMRTAFPSGVEFAIDRWRYRAALFGGFRPAQDLFQSTLRGEPVDVFHCFSPDALWIAAALVNIQPKPSRCVAGVYVPRGYVIGPRVFACPTLASFAYPAEVLFQKHLPQQSRFYMNEAVKQALERLNPSPVPGVIWPLPVDGTPYQALRRAPEKGTVISVGRLARMKEYNLWMIDVVDQLVREGLQVRWEVYGDGPLRQPMEEQIRARRLEDLIELKGTIPYERLPEAFSRAHCFVGMGTTLIEAGFAGVPSVVARSFDTTGLTYGFLHDLPEYSCGEQVDQPLKPAKDVVRQVLTASDTEYDRLSTAERDHAGRFDLGRLMPYYMELVEAIPPTNHLWRPAHRYGTAVAYQSAVQVYRRVVGRNGDDETVARGGSR
jgi:glycosyltransferase involved in cell wall biosynthesis